MLNHVEHASSAASVGAAISHSPMLNGTGLAVGGSVTVASVIDSHADAANEVGYWFTHTGLGVFSWSQICTIIGTLWVIVCATNMAYQLFKSIKTKPRKPRKPQEPIEKTPENTQNPPVIQAGSGGGRPLIK